MTESEMEMAEAHMAKLLTEHDGGLMAIAREMHCESEKAMRMVAKVEFLDPDMPGAEHLAKIAALRAKLIQTAPVTPMDRLVMFGAVRAVAFSQLLCVEALPESETEPFVQVRAGLTEILMGLAQLKAHMEAAAGATFEDLNLFVDGKALH